MNIFELQQSAQDKDFVLKNGSLEFEVFADILRPTIYWFFVQVRESGCELHGLQVY